ncbi:NADPH:quinone reductase [Quadrisphaera granulorum]|uniref:NADPH:quinone reductase-like Zn-dependent oxidoreductase n=1 Tax=Quadrisphaera granulorum TaxID=317664 RepID=A0A316A8E3_9ACTN|nr:zinc-binding alcohol dehydrogenase family protein [Quadrisphaera granulorum]PWJ54196.1 NADPH:quinone reductase-like Zn-dependent oxidoreductase [Quadrisphaera granulorum]SZE96335.1 NADPH:quinone reductase [Quadrisphaera granulorum]
MKAAVVLRFNEAPQYRDLPEPSAAPAGREVIVNVLAVGLHPRVRSQASGSHYTSTDQLPFVPGIDGVGRDPQGQLRYFVLPDTALGSLAERTLIDPRRSVLLPDHADPVAIAATMNPAMSSWVALRRRADFRAGQSVAVLGATGSAGRLAVQMALHLGASRVVAVARNAERLDALTAAFTSSGTAARVETVTFTGDQGDGDDDGAAQLGLACSRVDVVVDYLWGQPTAQALRAVIPARADDDQRLTWVQVGSVAGATSPIPSAALRATNLALLGSGQGSVSTRDIVDELGELAALVTSGGFQLTTRTEPLSRVEKVWAAPGDPDERLVLIS